MLPSDLLGMPSCPLSKSFMETFKRCVINVAVISKDIPYTFYHRTLGRDL